MEREVGKTMEGKEVVFLAPESEADRVELQRLVTDGTLQH
jgi:hypothetical protein